MRKHCSCMGNVSFVSRANQEAALYGLLPVWFRVGTGVKRGREMKRVAPPSKIPRACWEKG